MTFKLRFPKNPGDTPPHSRRRTSSFSYIVGLLFILLLTYLVYTPQEKTLIQQELKVSDIVGEDITVKKDLTLEDKTATGARRKEARETVIPIYEYFGENQAKSRNMLVRFFNFIRNARQEYTKLKNGGKERTEKLAEIKDSIAAQFGLTLEDREVKTTLDSNFFVKVDLNNLVAFFKSLYDKRILSSLTGAARSKDGTIKVVPTNGEPEIIRLSGVYDRKRAETALLQFVKEQAPTESTRTVDFIASFLKEFINENISYSDNLTQEESDRLAAAVNPVMIKLKANKVILRKGDEVKPEDMRILRLIATAERTRAQKLPNYYLIAVLLLTLGLFGRQFYAIWESGSINREKILRVTAATLLASAIIYRVCRFLFPLILKNLTVEFPYDLHSIFFAIPFGFGALCIVFIFNLQSAVIYSFINAIIGGMICDWDFRIALYILLGNLAVSFGIEFYQRLKRSPIIKAAVLWLLPINALMVILFNLTEPNVTLEHLSVDVINAAFAALVTPILAAFLIPLWETVFNLVTELKLIELTNLNLPIFREMLEKAPGTYHHSQMVASLSEAAAQDLGLSPLMLTAMALYHDIGKIDTPNFFTENHSLYASNPHDKLSPQQSAKNITAHITNGMERANKLKLPTYVSSSIKQHHGTKLVRFFYDKARDMSTVDSDGFDDKAFRYEGEKPKNIENAVIMLADQVEAASKSLAAPSDQEVKNIIGKIIEINIEENQFDQCEGLTFKALNSIANSFHKKLSSIYHMRISYPGFDFKDKEKEAKNSNGIKE